MLLVHLMRAAASRTFCTAGRSNAIKMPMMAITTSSSTSVNARRRNSLTRNIDDILSEKNDKQKKSKRNERYTANVPRKLANRTEKCKKECGRQPEAGARHDLVFVACKTGQLPTTEEVLPFPLR